MNPRFLVVLSFVVLASFASGKTIILSQTINVNGSAVNDTNNYLSSVSASNDSGSHTFRFARAGLSNLTVTINDQTGGASSSGGNMSQWYIDADTGSTYTVLNETLVRILSGTGISTSIVGGDVFVENTGVINEADPLSCHTDGSSCPSFVTYTALNTILNGQNNLSLLQIKDNLGNYTANPAGYYNITTLPTWAYNASYVTYTVLNGQANVSPASITGNLTSYATNAALLANATAVNDSWKANVTGYYPRNANPLGYLNTTTAVDLSSYVNLTILNGQLNTTYNATYDAAAKNTSLATYAALSSYVNLTILNGQNNLSLAAIMANLGNYTSNPQGYYNSTTLPLWSYNVTYATAITDLQNANKTLNTSITNARTAIGDLQTANTTLNTSITNARTAIGDLQTANITLNASVVNARTAISDLQTANTTVNTSVTNLRAVVASFVNLTLAQVAANLGNYTSNPAGYYNSSTLPGGGGDNSSWRQDVYWTNATATFATHTGLLNNLTAVNDSWKANVTGYYPRNSNPLGYNNISCTGSNSTHANVTNGSTCIMVASNPGGGSSSSPTIYNYSYQEGYLSLNYGVDISTASILNLNSTGKCQSFLVNRGYQLVFNNISYMVVTANVSVGLYMAVYNCTSANGIACTSGSILMNSSNIRMSNGMNASFTNTTGDWVLPSGNYVLCISANVTNAQATIKGSLGNGNTGPGMYLLTGLQKGGMPTTATFSLNAATTMPMGWLYDVKGVVN